MSWILSAVLAVLASIGTVLETAERGEVQVSLPEPPPPTTTTTLPPEPVRPEFDGTSVNGVCVGAIPLLEWYSPGWSSWSMAGIMYRESRCDPTALYPNRSVSTATGLLQILQRTHCPWISTDFGVNCTTQWLQNPYNNIRAAAELYRKQGSNAWAQTR